MITRAALVETLDRWFAALANGSAAGLPLAPGLRFTEQSVPIPVGDGLFVSCTCAPEAFKIVAADPDAGQVAALALIEQLGRPVLAAVRLRVADGLIHEAQHLIADPLTPTGLRGLAAPEPAMLADVAEADRTPRERMVAIADSYFEALEQEDGSLCPFDPACRRRESGMQTANNPDGPAFPIESPPPELAAALRTLGAMSPGEQIDTQVMQYITMIRPRHLIVVDEQKGLVFGFPRFVHRADRQSVPVRNVDGLAEMPVGFAPFDLQAAEIFKIVAGQLVEIEAAGFMNAYLAPTGWEDLYPECYARTTTHPHTWPFEAPTRI